MCAIYTTINTMLPLMGRPCIYTNLSWIHIGLDASSIGLDASSIGLDAPPMA